MTNNSEIPPVLSPESPRRPRYLPPEPKKSSWFSKPQKSPKTPEPTSTQLPDEPPALPVFSNSLFSYKGRMGRLSLQASNLSLTFVMVALMVVLTIIAIAIGAVGNIHSITQNPSSLGFGILGLIAIPMIIMIVYSIIFQVRRLHDLNRTGWWILLPIPFSIANMITTYSHIWHSSYISTVCTLVGGVFYLYLLLMPGTPTNNRYGPPRYTPTFEKVLGWIQIVFMTLILTTSYFFLKPFLLHSQDANTDLDSINSTTSAGANTKFSAPYPFTAQQLWANILKVTALPDGKLTQAQIESAFETTLKPETLPIVGKIFQAHAGTDWYFSLKLMPIKMFEQNLEIFTFSWNDQAGSLGSTPPEGMCINLSDIQSSLLSQGWTAKPQDESNRTLSKIEYNKGTETGVIIAYAADTKCLKQLNLITPTKA